MKSERMGEECVNNNKKPKKKIKQNAHEKEMFHTWRCMTPFVYSLARLFTAPHGAAAPRHWLTDELTTRHRAPCLHLSVVFIKPCCMWLPLMWWLAFMQPVGWMDGHLGVANYSNAKQRGPGSTKWRWWFEEVNRGEARDHISTFMVTSAARLEWDDNQSSIGRSMEGTVSQEWKVVHLGLVGNGRWTFPWESLSHVPGLTAPMNVKI